jgi:hypothetical protein
MIPKNKIPLFLQVPAPDYPRGYVTRIMAIDAIITLVGLFIAAMPFAMGWYPGAFDTTVHVAVGVLIATLGAFRVLLAYGSSWVEIVLIPLGIIVLRLPHFMHHEGWDPKYTNTHVAAGAIVIIAAIISGLMTTIEMKKTAR